MGFFKTFSFLVRCYLALGETGMDLMLTLRFFLESCLVDYLVKLIVQTFSVIFFIQHALDIFSMDRSAPFQLVYLWPFPAIRSMCTLFREISLSISLSCS